MRCKLKYKVRVVCESHLVQNTKYSTLNILVITSTVLPLQSSRVSLNTLSKASSIRYGRQSWRRRERHGTTALE